MLDFNVQKVFLIFKGMSELGEDQHRLFPS